MLPGQPAPLGSHVVAVNGTGGVNFALYAPQAQQVALCLFLGGREKRFALTRSGDIWHGFVPGVGAGTLYGYRVHGIADPARGILFNPAKLLLDPYAKAIDGKPDFSSPEAAQRFHWQDSADNAAIAPKSVVVYGASNTGTVGGIVLKNLRRRCAVYPINPRATELQGRPCYPNLDSLPETPELAVFVVNSETVVREFERFCLAGGKGAIIVSDGFAESGRRELEDRLRDLSAADASRFR